MPVPVDGLYQILSGGPFSTGGKACLRPGVDNLVQIFGASPYNAMMNWRWQPAPGGSGSTMTSDNGLVLCYTPTAGSNVQLRPASLIGDLSAVWLAMDIGQGYCTIVPILDPLQALTIDDGGPPWQTGQVILAEGNEMGQSVAQTWMFLALGEDQATAPESVPAYQPAPGLAI